MNKKDIFITILLFTIGALCYILFEAVQVRVFADPLTNKLFCGFMARIGLAALFAWLICLSNGQSYFRINLRFIKTFAWSLPCFLVAFVNFPFSALITHSASIDRGDLIGIYLLYTLSVSLLEEFVFRGIIFMIIAGYFMRKKHGVILTTAINAAIFSLFHLTNLFLGVDFLSVLLQCAYTFLIGAMLTACMIKIKSLWLCVIIHAIFDFGGLLIIHLGSGNPWDLTFWILTIVIGLLCAGHIIYSLIKLEKDYVSR